MPIPYDQIKADIKAKDLTRINQLFEYATIEEWKEAIGFRKGVVERLMEDPKRFEFRHIFYIHQATGIKEATVRRLVVAQKKYNWAAKREGGRKEEHRGPRQELR